MKTLFILLFPLLSWSVELAHFQGHWQAQLDSKVKDSWTGHGQKWVVHFDQKGLATTNQQIWSHGPGPISQIAIDQAGRPHLIVKKNTWSSKYNHRIVSVETSHDKKLKTLILELRFQLQEKKTGEWITPILSHRVFFKRDPKMSERLFHIRKMAGKWNFKKVEVGLNYKVYNPLSWVDLSYDKSELQYELDNNELFEDFKGIKVPLRVYIPNLKTYITSRNKKFTGKVLLGQEDSSVLEAEFNYNYKNQNLSIRHPIVKKTRRAKITFPSKDKLIAVKEMDTPLGKAHMEAIFEREPIDEVTKKRLNKLNGLD